MADQSAVSNNSNAMVGPSTEANQAAPDPVKLQAQHTALIKSIITKTIKIQKETKNRRFRDAQPVLMEVIKSLTEFKEEPWPPPHKADIMTPPEWMKSPDRNSGLHQLDNSMRFQTIGVDDTDTETVASSAMTSVAASEVGSVDVEAAKNYARPFVERLESVRVSDVSLEDDDPQTKEPMHDAIIEALDAYCMIMGHPNKTPRMVELTLDCVSLLITNHYVSGRAGGRDDESGSGNPVGTPIMEKRPPSMLHTLIESISRCSESASDVVQTAMTKTLLVLLTSQKCGIHEASMLMAVRATFHVYLVSKSPSAKDAAKTALIDMLKAVFNRMEAFDIMTRSSSSPDLEEKKVQHELQQRTRNEGSNEGEEPNFSAFASQFHTDSYLLFRALCKLSAKTLPGDEGDQAATSSKLLSSFSAPVDPLALHSKMLSLELILAVFEHCGEAFRTGEKFIYAVQNYLCVSLLKNCMSNHTQVAYLSLKIFLILVYKFKGHLKSEIEVFVANIFLRVLESPNSSFEQKALVLEALRALCSDPLMITQVFLNYDCDFDAVNLYRNIVHNLTRLSSKHTRAAATSSTTKKDSKDFELSLAGVEVLVVILRAFLKALGLPGGDDLLEEDGPTSRIRGTLQLDIGLAVKPDPADEKVESVEEVPISAADIRSPTADVANKIVDAFDRKRLAQHNFETGCVKFTLSLKGGLLYFIENGFVQLNAKDIAHFFHEHKDRLDKTQIGEVLGKEPESSFVKEKGIDAEEGGEGFFVRVLHHYVDEMDFTGLEFDEAIRLFLSGFRLPGEAQKIDRIMEKFAERFTRQNLDVFPSADTAFILAFSVIMLNTDLHNPSIKPEKRMTIESFIRNNRGISVDGGDLPQEFLTGIFNRIQAQAFTLKEDDDAREKQANGGADSFDTSFLFEAPTFFGGSSEERKREKFRKEREEMMAASELLFKKRPGKSGAEKASIAASAQLTESISPADVVRPMFDVTWGPLIGTISQILEQCEDERSVALCLNGFVYAIRISSHSGMSLALETFVNSLAKFTFLGSIKEMKHKNIEAIRTLMSIAVIDGEFLGECWGPVLQCISQLGRLQLISSGLQLDEKFLSNPSATSEEQHASILDGTFFRQPTKAETNRETEEINGRAVLAAVNEVLIDKVFSSTVNLSATSMSLFVQQLIAVSEAEIAGLSKQAMTGVGIDASGSNASEGESGPRIFSLQRLVEVADYNMDVRPRLVWAQMWEMISMHLSKIGCHENAMVSMFAIDALRQLSFKFLEKPELSDFSFQQMFLKPFLLIMEDKSSREDTRELILRCVDNMVRSMSQNLRSGWKICFTILTISASDPSDKINTLGLAILQRLLDEHLHQVCRIADDEADEEELAGEASDMTRLEQRQRNANVEDFVGLCRASLSFVPMEHSEHRLPVGLSMRALCHTACFADLIAEKKVLPPVSGVQWTDASASGYTYEGLSSDEALKMALWRPLLDGLANGIASTARSNNGGVGCLVQRGSVMTMRAILLRHGSMFSIEEWLAVLQQTILPAIQRAAETDNSAVIKILSESPSVSSLDFLTEPMALPPPPDDEGLLKFAEQAQSLDGAPQRPLGSAELLVEASFADLRHAGNGDLSQAHLLIQKGVQRKKRKNEQPFPDSWIATTAPIALGMLTDIASEIMLARGETGREKLWPVIMEQFTRWTFGEHEWNISGDDIYESNNNEEGTGEKNNAPWLPCEALVRIGCHELHRFPQKLFEALPRLSKEEAYTWACMLCKIFVDALEKNVTLEGVIHDELVKSKLASLGLAANGEENEEEKVNGTTNDDQGTEEIVSTPYGRGKLVGYRVDRYENGKQVTINIIELDSGATLYGTPQPREEPKSPREGRKLLAREKYLDRFIPALKVRCIAAHSIQNNLPSVVNVLSTMAGKDAISSLLECLEKSRSVARKATIDEDLAHAFQEAIFSEWGDGVEEVEEALGTVGGRGGSKMFFLTQEAGANKAIIHLLSLLYSHQTDELGDPSLDWDRKSFAEPLLVEAILDVLRKFLESEEKDGGLVDANVWRMPSARGAKIAIYCTSFASVVVMILKCILDFDKGQFFVHRKELFPLLCGLVKVRSDEIRQLVYETLMKHVTPFVGEDKDQKMSNGN